MINHSINRLAWFTHAVILDRRVLVTGGNIPIDNIVN